MRRRAPILVLTLALSACLSGGGAPPYRLYPSPPQPLGPSEVSTLVGYVQFVDGKDVSSLGRAFELLPGCHLVVTPTRWGDHLAGDQASVSATTGHWMFALPMKAGHRYWIEVMVGQLTGPTGPLTIKGHERDLDGKTTREFEGARSEKDIDACRKDAARVGAL